jgi:hypothetical protein
LARNPLTKKVDYIASFYCGDSKDSLYTFRDMLEKHARALSLTRTLNEFDRVIFVVNCDNPNTQAESIIDAFESKVFIERAELQIRANEGYSYGAWEVAVGVPSPDKDYFLVEGDYLPQVQFIQSFRNYLNPYTMFVAQKISNIPGSAPDHAAVSNGLLSGQWASYAYAKFGRIFALYPFTLDRRHHLMGCENQVMFLALMQNLGGKSASLHTAFSIPFWETTLGSVFEAGNPGAPAPLIPYQVE